MVQHLELFQEEEPQRAAAAEGSRGCSLLQTTAGQDRHSASSSTYMYQFQRVDVIVNEHDDAYVKEGLREFAQDVIHGLEARFPDDSSRALF